MGTRTKRDQVSADQFFRMGFITQDTSATTTRTYLARIIEATLSESDNGLTTQELLDNIQQKYCLEFTQDEVKAAYGKCRDTKIDKAGKWHIAANRANGIVRAESPERELCRLSEKAVDELSIAMRPADLEQLIKNYLYHCFNSSVDMILSLVEGRQRRDYSDFEASDEEIEAIDKFLSWDNQKKDGLVYKLVSYCYIYCSLTTKKNSLLTKNIFRGKRFCLDTNILFRLAGVNNDDRKRSTVSFIEKCREAGIGLYCTNQTVDELFRVIKSKVIMVRDIARGQEPIDAEELGAYGNDFYNIYCDWCRDPRNRCGDFVSFQNHLNDTLVEILDRLDVEEFDDYSVISGNEFEAYFASLRDYKAGHARRTPNESSVAVDVNNYMYVLGKRKARTRGSIFDTNEFLVSADHRFINWAAEKNRGIPVVVLPSVWLTILLRFTGRSADDYKAFCAFMELRTHEGPEKSEVFTILRSLNCYASNKELRRRIVCEILDNREEYELQDEESTDKSIHDAFDKVREDEVKELKKDYDAQIASKGEIVRRSEREANANAIARTDVTRRIKKAERGRNVCLIAFCLVVALFIVGVICWIYELQPVSGVFESAIPNRYANEDGSVLELIGLYVSLFGVVFALGKCIFSQLLSDARRKRLIIARRQEILEGLDSSVDA